MATSATEQTTQASSLVTLDGYVSHGPAPSPLVTRDHTMLQEFTSYLEHRLKSQNLWLLRRFFADFLNEQESQLLYMMQQGCTIVTIFPVLQTNDQRLSQAKALLANPKFPLCSDRCVFFFLRCRTATRNMALLRQLFLDFVNRRETSLMEFVERGCEVMSVIPFQMPQVYSVAVFPEQETSPDTEVKEKVASKVTEKKKKRQKVKVAPVASPVKMKVVQKKTNEGIRRVSKSVAAMECDSAPQQHVVIAKKAGNKVNSVQKKKVAASKENASDAVSKLGTKKRSKRPSAVSVTESAASKEIVDATPHSASVETPRRAGRSRKRDLSHEASAVTTDVPTPKRGRKAKTTIVTDEAEEKQVAPAVLTPKRGKKTKKSVINDGTEAKAVTTAVASSKRGRKAKVTIVTDEVEEKQIAPAVLTPKRGKKTKKSVVNDEAEANAVITTETLAEAPQDEVVAAAPAKQPQACLALTVKDAEAPLAETTPAEPAQQPEAPDSTTVKDTEAPIAEILVAAPARQPEASVAMTVKETEIPLAEATLTEPETPSGASHPTKENNTETFLPEIPATAPKQSKAPVSTRVKGTIVCLAEDADTMTTKTPQMILATIETPAEASPDELAATERAKQPEAPVADTVKTIDTTFAEESATATATTTAKEPQASVAAEKDMDAPLAAATSTEPSKQPVISTVKSTEACLGEAAVTITANKPQAIVATTGAPAEAPMDDVAASVRAKQPEAPVSGTVKTTDTTLAGESATATAKQPEASAATSEKNAEASLAETAPSEPSKQSEAPDSTTGKSSETFLPEISAPAQLKQSKALVITTVKTTKARLAEAAATAIAKEAEAFLAKNVVATTTKQVEAPLAQDSDYVTALVEQTSVQQTEEQDLPKPNAGQNHNVASIAGSKEKPRKRGKPPMSEDMCRSQLELAQKMEPFEAQIPWEVVYANLPAPFDELRHAELSRKYRKFWRKHARAVWERNFWVPMSRKMNLAEFNKRNNRQLTAKNGFETVIVSAYHELGAAFFVMLDSQKSRHPGWWYRGPVVALFALQQNKGEEVVWDYVEKEALERFPDCKLPLPLEAPNSAAVSKCHTRESDSMWIANHRLAPTILNEITALKAKLETEMEHQHVML